MKAIVASLFAVSAVLAGTPVIAADNAVETRFEVLALNLNTTVARDEEKKTDDQKKSDNEEKKTDEEKKSDNEEKKTDEEKKSD